MSDKAWFQNHVQIIEECRKRVIFMKMSPEYAGYMKRGLEVLSALLWVMMVLWIELCAIILYVFIFVSSATCFDGCHSPF